MQKTIPITKQGNSLYVLIPIRYARQYKLHNGSHALLEEKDNQIIITIGRDVPVISVPMEPVKEVESSSEPPEREEDMEHRKKKGLLERAREWAKGKSEQGEILR